MRDIYVRCARAYLPNYLVNKCLYLGVAQARDEEPGRAEI